MLKSCELLKEQELETKKPNAKQLGLRGMKKDWIVICESH